MPEPQRKFSGPNGFNNFLPDNGEIVLTRDVNDNIVTIEIESPIGKIYTRTITRNPDGSVASISFWTEV